MDNGDKNHRKNGTFIKKQRFRDILVGDERT